MFIPLRGTYLSITRFHEWENLLYTWYIGLAARLGVEPRPQASKTLVLPLHYPALFQDALWKIISFSDVRKPIPPKAPSELHRIRTCNLFSKIFAVCVFVFMVQNVGAAPLLRFPKPVCSCYTTFWIYKTDKKLALIIPKYTLNSNNVCCVCLYFF